MNLLERYIARQYWLGFALATAVLVPLFCLFGLAEELEDVGTGRYGFGDALIYVALLAPRRFLELSPFIGLFGGIVGLGSLAANHELSAMRAGGLSPGRVARAVLLAALVPIALIVLGELYVAPVLQQKAIADRAVAQGGANAAIPETGVWTRHAGEILRIGAMRHGRMPVDVEILSMRSESRLARYIYARRAEIRPGGEWQLHKVTVKRFPDGSVQSRRIDTMTWQPFLSTAEVDALQLPSQSLSALDLYAYLRYLRATNQPAAQVALVLWRKAGRGVLTIGMALLTVAFVFTAPRVGLAPRLALGLLTGVVVYVLDQIVSNTGIRVGIAPLWLTLTPGLLLALLTALYLRRVG